MTQCRGLARARREGTVAVAALLALLAPAASAAVITSGLTFAVASESDTTTGTHYHSNISGDLGNPPGKAEVGRFLAEEVRGLSEFNLAGLFPGTATLTFSVFKEGGLFAAQNDTPFTGAITIEAYKGNNAEDVSDYHAAVASVVGSFAVSPAGLNVGDVLSFDVTSIFNAALAGGDSSLGLRLRADPLNSNSEAWTFDTFQLTSPSECVPGTPGCNGTVPEPATLSLLGLAFAGLAGFRRRNE